MAFAVVTTFHVVCASPSDSKTAIAKLHQHTAAEDRYITMASPDMLEDENPAAAQLLYQLQQSSPPLRWSAEALNHPLSPLIKQAAAADALHRLDTGCRAVAHSQGCYYPSKDPWKARTYLKEGQAGHAERVKEKEAFEADTYTNELREEVCCKPPHCFGLCAASDPSLCSRSRLQRPPTCIKHASKMQSDSGSSVRSTRLLVLWR